MTGECRMTWEYRVLHDVHEVSEGTTEDTYSIVEAYHAEPGKVHIVAEAPNVGRVECTRCGTIGARPTWRLAVEMARSHTCPEVTMWSEDINPYGETVEELVSDLVLMLRACWKPVLERKDLPNGEIKPPRLPHWHVRTFNVPWTGGWHTETMGQAVDAFIAARGPFPTGTRFEVRPADD